MSDVPYLILSLSYLILSYLTLPYLTFGVGSACEPPNAEATSRGNELEK